MTKDLEDIIKSIQEKRNTFKPVTTDAEFFMDHAYAESQRIILDKLIQIELEAKNTMISSMVENLTVTNKTKN